MNEQQLVEPNFRDQAMRRLRSRMKAGEKPEDILQITDKFYLDKVVAGLMPMTYTIYDRIMGCSQEDGVTRP